LAKPIKYKLIGYQRTQDMIGEWPKKLRIEVKKAVVKAAIVDIETPAKMKLTTDGHVDTGRLRADIHTEYEGSSRRELGKIGELDARVGTNVEYAGYVERIDEYLTWAYRKGVPKLRNAIAEAVHNFARR
jgi:hypothetical protein